MEEGRDREAWEEERPYESLHDGLSSKGVESCGGLVEEEQRGVGDELLANAQALALTTREAATEAGVGRIRTHVANGVVSNLAKAQLIDNLEEENDEADEFGGKANKGEEGNERPAPFAPHFSISLAYFGIAFHNFLSSMRKLIDWDSKIPRRED